MKYTNRKQNIIRQLTSLFLLVFLLFSAVGHTHKVDVTKSNGGQQECYLCQHLLDSVPGKIKLAPVDIGQFNQSLAQPYIVTSSQSFYLSPQLRAPPTSF
ncbi:hypothetical protein ACOYR1_02195 [Thalassotalea piscium]